jgi:small subunit ribosomal protein S20
VANIKSQLKRIKTNKIATERNKAVSKGVLHQNNAANKKSAMAKKAASL